MYEVEVKVIGSSVMLHHRYPMPEFETMGKGSKKQTGAVDYTQEWRSYLYANGRGIFQPAAHFEAAMIAAATNFKVQGKRGKSYKDLFKAAVFVTPDEIPFNMEVPAELDTDGDKPLYLDMRPVVVNRARVVRIRPAFKPGWELEFAIQVIDDSLHYEVVQDVLVLAGKTIGVGDYRPRFGRFTVVRFELAK